LIAEVFVFRFSFFVSAIQKPPDLPPKFLIKGDKKMQFDTTTSSSWKFGHRGRVAVFIDGNNLFHAARFHNIDIDYNKLLRLLFGDGRLLRAFFYTGVDAGAERQQGFLLWMRRNGFRVVQKELKTFYDGTRKANLDVEIAVDMLSSRADTTRRFWFPATKISFTPLTPSLTKAAASKSPVFARTPRRA
jgi:hypothetical protein